MLAVASQRRVLLSACTQLAPAAVPPPTRIHAHERASLSCLRPPLPRTPCPPSVAARWLPALRHHLHTSSTLSGGSPTQPGYIGVSSPPTSSLANELNLRCTVLTPAGIKSVSGAFRKMDLCLEHGLEPRDLRKVDSRIPNLVPTILARKQAFLVNILHIRALIKSDTVFLFDSYGSTDTTLHSAFVYNLEHNLRAPISSNKLPFEFRALETALSSALDALRSELYLTSDMVHHLLESLDTHINRENLGMLLQFSRKVNAFLRRAQGVKTAASEVLESDADMALMYLTDAQAGHPRDPNTSSVEELELLLESFEKQVEEVVSEAESMASNIQNTQEVVELILDSNRNDLLNLDLRTSLTTLAVSSGTLVSGLFGMNLLSHLEENAYAFYGVSSVVGCITAGVMVAGWRLLARMRRVGLQQGSGMMSAGASWHTYPHAAHIGGAHAIHSYGPGNPAAGLSPGFTSPAALGTAGMGPSLDPAGASQASSTSTGSTPPESSAASAAAAQRHTGHAYGAAAPWRHSSKPGRARSTNSSSSSASSSSSMLNRLTHALWRLSGGRWREKRRGLREKLAQAQAVRLAQAQAQAQAQAEAQAQMRAQAQAQAQVQMQRELQAEAEAEVEARTSREEAQQPTSAASSPAFFNQNDDTFRPDAAASPRGGGGSLRLELEREAAAWLAERHAEEAKWRERTYVREPVGAFGAWGRSTVDEGTADRGDAVGAGGGGGAAGPASASEGALSTESSAGSGAPSASGPGAAARLRTGAGGASLSGLGRKWDSSAFANLSKRNSGKKGSS